MDHLGNGHLPRCRGRHQLRAILEIQSPVLQSAPPTSAGLFFIPGIPQYVSTTSLSHFLAEKEHPFGIGNEKQ
jgi:hypothetical protein